MFYISKSNIRKLAMNEITYSRGLRYYKLNAVKSVSWSQSSSQYRAIVKGGMDYVVIISVENKKFTYSCTCPSSKKFTGGCKHVVAVLLSISEYYDHKGESENLTQEEQVVSSLIGYFERQSYSEIIGESFKLEILINIDTILKNKYTKADICLRAGSQKLYKIQNIKKFLEQYINEENIILGKDFKYTSGESHFEESSLLILDYLTQIYEINETTGGNNSYYYNIFNKSRLSFTKNMLIKLLRSIGDNRFNLELYGQVYNDVSFHNNNPIIKYSLDVENQSIALKKSENEKVIPITESGELLFINNAIYLTDKKFTKNYIPFYNHFNNNDELKFSGDNKKRFLETILPKINETMEIDIPAEIKNKYIAAELKCKLYLDRIKNNIKTELIYQYDNVEINPLKNDKKNDAIILRQAKKEDEAIATLEKLGFATSKDYFVMKDEKDIYDFLTKKIQDLGSMFEIFYSESFKNIKVKQNSNIGARLKMNEEIDLFEMEFDYDGLDNDELKDLFNSYKLKKKYFRLKDGTFINLENSELSDIVNIMDYLDIQNKDIKKNMTLPLSQALYLNSAFENTQNINVEKNEYFNKFIDLIRNPEQLEIKAPDELNAELRPYQLTGLKWLKTLSNNKLGGILADDMGLGKTLQSIVYILSKKADINEPSLIVCPTSLVYNWQDEIEIFAPTLHSVVISGKPEERQDLLNNISNIDIIITSYPLIRRDIEYYCDIQFDTCFIDEAQYIKNPNSQSSKAVKQINARSKFALTGTPIENSLIELWSIFDFVMPGYLLSYNKFTNKFEKPIVKDSDKKVLEDLTKKIRPFILRRMKKDVLTELPEKIETKMLTELTDSQKKVYASFMENLKSEINSEVAKNGFEKSKLKILAGLTRLRQICCHPATFIENYRGDSGKLELLMEILPDAIENGHRVLIFSQFTSMLSIIESEIKKLDIGYFYLTGDTESKVRGDYVKRFNNGEGSVFLISLKAGGTGLNLTGADTVIHYDPWWNPAVEEQATDRVYRIGQKNSVQVIKLLTKGTIEEKIYKLQKNKKDLADSVIESGEVFLNKLSEKDIEDIFEFNM